MSTIKGRNSKDLREAKEVKKRGKKYPEKLYKKKLLMTPDSYDGVFIHLEPDTLAVKSSVP